VLVRLPYRNLYAPALLWLVSACGDAVVDQSQLAPQAAPDVSAPARVSGSAPADAAILFEPVEATEPVPIPGAAYLGQSASTFQPSLLVVRRGQAVEFSNDEEVIHNVHVTDEAGGTVFNVTTLFFSTYTHVFDEPGVYDVACGIHPVMRATVVVSDAPYSTVSDAEGGFEISLPVGAYEVSVEGADPAQQRRATLEVAGAEKELIFD
jgi:plastocyanin